MRTQNPKTNSAGTDRPIWVWSRLSSVRWEDAWEERLRFLPPGSLMMVSSPRSRALRIKAYTDATTARKLARVFGGEVRRLERAQWNRELARELTPLRVRGRLVVYSEAEPWKAHRLRTPDIPALHIPASMAFGTGSHPTTAGCLRLLADETERLRQSGQDSWRQADLGTGSGILALAGRVFGAGHVEALDYDPLCLRETRRNARTNRLQLDALELVDVLHWQPPEPFDLLTANLFSDTLIAAAPRLAAALQPSAALIYSGVLREQLAEVHTAFQRAGLRPEWHNARGKWIFGLARKSALKPSRKAK